MPGTAQDRIRRAPSAALLILLSLFLNAATSAAAGTGIRQPTPRVGSTRAVAPAAILPSALRSVLDEQGGTGAGSLLPPPPGIVTEALPTRPAAEARRAAGPQVPQPNKAAYRARAPPAR